MSVPAPARWLVIYNPLSGGRHRRNRRARLEHALQRAGIEYDLVETSAHEDATRLAALAVADGRLRIACAGGDGTANHVVNGMFAAASIAQRAELKLGLIPLGTGNDWARTLGLPRNMAAACRILNSAISRCVDVGSIRVTTPAGWSEHLFVNVAGAGFDAQVAAQMSGRSKTAWCYLQGLLRGLRHVATPYLTVHCDNRAAFAGDALLVAVALGRQFGSGLRIAPHAKLDDGAFDVVVVPALSALRIFAHLPALLFGDVSRSRWLNSFACAELTIDGNALVEADGELLGSLPASVRIHPAALQVLAPP